MVVVPMIKAVWKIIYFVSGLMGIVNFVQTFLPFLQNLLPAVNYAKTVLSYLYFFLPKADIKPLIEMVFYCGAVRIAMAVVNLLWW